MRDVKQFVSCMKCGNPYPDSGLPYVCPRCGGLFDYGQFPAFDPGQKDRTRPGLWRYGKAFGIPAEAEPVSLGEGNTPLVWARVFGREVAFKCEYTNPTGSFKDRGSTLIATWLKYRQIPEAIEDSSGNAGASLAAYAARAGIRARIFIPASASGPKRAHIEATGAELVPVEGSRTAVSEAVRREADGRGMAYASHAYLPFNLPGYATAAYEIYEQLGNSMPGAVIVPAGQGGLLLGLGRGFDNLRVATEDKQRPMIMAVQARNCASLWAAFTPRREDQEPATEKQTLAEGVKVRYPVRAEAVLSVIQASGGSVCAVAEEAILPGRAALAQLGFYVEPTSAIVWAALEQTIQRLPDPIVVVLTGSGYKWQPNP
jgi:threonine synthase